MSYPLTVYYGPGKGKSTSALGCTLRALGHDQQVLLVQFIKKPQVSGEQNIVSKIGIDYYCAGNGFVFQDTPGEQKTEHEQAARLGLDFVEEYLEQHDPGLIVLDELLHVYWLFPRLHEQLLRLISEATNTCTTIVTGSDLPDPIREIASYVYYLAEEKTPVDMECLEGFHF